MFFIKEMGNKQPRAFDKGLRKRKVEEEEEEEERPRRRQVIDECVNWVVHQLIYFDAPQNLQRREELDQLLGYWVHNVPYDITNVEMDFVRRYFLNVQDVKEAEIIPQLFDQRKSPEEEAQAKQYYRNGRRFYFITDRIEYVTSIVYPPRLCQVIPAMLPEAWFPLSQLICKNFKTRELMGYKNPSVICTVLGEKIAKSLIKIASTRIFAEPEQSIIELPVNCVDSYNPGGQVGKFGMGFFSILYWLMGHPRRYLTIESFNNYTHFVCVMQELDGELQFKLQVGDTNVYQNGVYVHLNCQEDLLTKHNVKQFHKQLQKLEFISSALIAYREDERLAYGALGPFMNKQHPNIIYVQQNVAGVKVEDFAGGMSLQVLLQKLFVPSVSTKTIQASLQEPVGPVLLQSRILLGQQENRFVILVRSVAVVNLTYTNDTPVKYEIILELPGSTRIPVSRDDIIITPRTKEDLRREMGVLEQQSWDLKTVYPLQQALQAYCTYTSQSDNKTFFEFFVKQLQLNLGHTKIAVNYQFYDWLKWLDENDRFVAAQKSNLLALEDYLTIGKQAHPDEKIGVKRYFSNIFLEKKVYILPNVTNTVSNAEMPSFLFVDWEYVQNYWYTWESILCNTITEQRLVSVHNLNSAPRVHEFFVKMVNDAFDAQIWNPERVYPSEKTRLFNLLFQIIQKMEAVIGLAETATSQSDDFVHEQIQMDIFGKKYRIKSQEDLMVFLVNDLMILYNLHALKTMQYLYLFYGALDKIIRHKVVQVYGKDSIITLILQTNTLPLIDKYDEEDGKNIFSYVEKRGVQQESRTFTEAFINKVFDWANYLLDCVVYESYQSKNSKLAELPMWSHSSPLLISLYVKPQRNHQVTDFLRQLSLFKAEVSCQQLFVISYLMNTTSWFESHPDFFTNFSFDEIYTFMLQFLEDIILNIDQFIKQQLSKEFSYRKSKVWMTSPGQAHTIPEVLKFNLALDTKMRVFEANQSQNILPLHVDEVPVFKAASPVYSFSESQLITHVLKHDFDSPETLFPLVANTSTESFEIQITELAINEGSTKTFINATLTETLQNSMDAIRMFQPPDNRLLLYLKESETHIMYQITDFVGMNFEAIVSVMIPFLSSKTPSQIVTGEMGSGFFNVYRESDTVIIETVKDQRRTLIIDRPVLDRNNRVVELERNVQTVVDGSYSNNHTSIFVFIPKPVRETVLVNFIYFATSVVGLLDIASQVRFNDQPLTVTTAPLFESEHAEFKTLKVTNNVQESYLLTKGVPFMPLFEYILNQVENFPSYLLADVKNNLVINIAHGAYTPVQTRSKINIPLDVKNRFFKFLLDSMYILLLEKCVVGNRDYYLRNYSSKATLDQITSIVPQFWLLDQFKTVADFVLHYKYPGTDATFHNLFSAARGRMQYKKWEEVKESDVEYIQALFPNELMRKLGLGWLKSKNIIQIKTNSAEENRKLDEKESITDPQRKGLKRLMERALGLYVNIYHRLGRQLGIAGFVEEGVNRFRLPSVEITRTTALGFYSVFESSLVLNQEYFSTKELAQCIEFFRTGTDKYWTPVKKLSIYRFCFKILKTGNVLAHELEHMRRGTDCNSYIIADPHSPTVGIFPDQPGVQYSFEDAAIAVLTRITAANIEEIFLNEVKAVLQ